ncbi:hypothetical protein D3C81_1415870 [compost metagenome]
MLQPKPQPLPALLCQRQAQRPRIPRSRITPRAGQERRALKPRRPKKGAAVHTCRQLRPQEASAAGSVLADSAEGPAACQHSKCFCSPRSVLAVQRRGMLRPAEAGPHQHLRRNPGLAAYVFCAARDPSRFLQALD